MTTMTKNDFKFLFDALEADKVTLLEIAALISVLATAMEKCETVTDIDKSIVREIAEACSSTEDKVLQFIEDKTEATYSVSLSTELYADVTAENEEDALAVAEDAYQCCDDNVFFDSDQTTAEHASFSVRSFKSGKIVQLIRSYRSQHAANDNASYQNTA
jgi:hypothetical protein